MDTSDPFIVFDEKGRCNHCKEFIAIRSNYAYHKGTSEKQLDELVSLMKKDGKNKPYDCVIGLSGGVDSSYVAFVMKQKGLRILGVHLDNGWNSEEAVHNIRNIAVKLEIGYESYVLNWEEFKRIQVAFLKASVPEADTPTDIAILSALHKVAARNGVKHILSGGNFATEGILPASWHYNAKDSTYFNHIFRNFGEGKIKYFPKFSFLSEAYYKICKGIKMHYILNNINYDKDVAKDILKEKLVWKDYGGKHYESRFTAFIQSYLLFRKFNIDYRRATLSSQICISIIDRESALQQLEVIPYSEETLQRDLAFIATKLEISNSQLQRILDSPPLWYVDYPNASKFLNFIYNSYRKIYHKEKLASF